MPDITRQSFVTRLELSLLGQVDAAARKAGLSRNAFVVQTLKHAVPRQPVAHLKSVAARPASPVAPVRPRREVTPRFKR